MEKPRKVDSLDRNRDEGAGCDDPRSPEFEFWMVRNPSLPQPDMLTADELFSDGVLLPLNLVPVSSFPPSGGVSSGPELTAVVSEPATGSRRWKDIFKMPESKSNKETTGQKVEDTKSDKKRNWRTNSGGGQTSSAELNINIWPFSRSRSAVTGSTRPKIATSPRKVSSAPCSRSNSGSESNKSRKWPASPARGGVHVGRSSPVWLVRRGGSAAISGLPAAGADRKRVNPGGGKEKNSKGCKEKIAAVNGGDTGCSNDGTGVVNRFNFRSLFSIKVY